MTIETRPEQPKEKERPYLGSQVREIQSNVPSFLIDALRTLPEVLKPHYFDATLRAFNIDLSKFGFPMDTDDEEKYTRRMDYYFSQTKEGGVLPFTMLVLQWDTNLGLFTPKYKLDEKPMKKEHREELAKRLKEGGRPNEIRYKAAAKDTQAFDKFIGPELDYFKPLDPPYSIEMVDLGLSIYRTRGYDEGTYFNAQIQMGQKKGNFVSVGTEVQLPIEQVEALNDWLADLVKLQ